MAGEFGLNTTPPWAPKEEAQPQAEEQNAEVTGQPPEEQTAGTSVIEEPPTAEPPKVDEFFESFNKRFSTQFKADDEVKNILDLPKKVSEYETKLKASEELAKSIENYKKRIEELEGSQDPLKYFSSPQAYVAEQLRIKYPKSNPVLLQEIAMTDVSRMDDLDVLIKDKQLFVHEPPKEQVIKSIILKKYGIDATVPPEEWDELSVGEMKLDAAAARDKINGLKEVIQMPEVITKEQREQVERDALAQKEQAIAPLREQFRKFEKFVHKDIPDFGFDVSSDYQSKLPDMFQAMFIDANMEPNEENYQSMVELRDALFIYQYLPKLREVWVKEGETKAKEVLDEKLHNTEPPNTTTATDHEEVSTLPGFDKFLSDERLR